MKTVEEHAEILSMALQSRSNLYLCGFITETENDKIHERIKKYQNKYKISGKLIKNHYE